MSSKEITIENKRDLNQMHHIQFMLILSFFQVGFNKFFSLDYSKRSLVLVRGNKSRRNGEDNGSATEPLHVRSRDQTFECARGI